MLGNNGSDWRAASAALEAALQEAQTEEFLQAFSTVDLLVALLGGYQDKFPHGKHKLL